MLPTVEQICDLFFAHNEKALVKIAEEGRFDFSIISPEKKDKNRSFIHIAILSNMTKLVKTLFNSGHYDVNKRDSQGYSYLSAAVLKGNYDLVDFFMDDMNIDDKNCINSARSIDMIKYLVDKGMDIEYIDRYGNNLLQNAIRWDLLDIAYWLITNYDKSFNINMKEATTGKTLLHSAVMCQNTSCMKYLLDKGFDIYIEDKRHNTPIMYAAKFGKFDSYKWLDEYKRNNGFDMKSTKEYYEMSVINKILNEQENYALKHHRDITNFTKIKQYRRSH